MSKSIVKYAENACEYKTMELLSIELNNANAQTKKPSSTLTSLYQNYLNNLPNLNQVQRTTLSDEIAKRLPLCEAVALSISKSLTQKYDANIVIFDVVPYNKRGLKQGVAQKSDINIDVYKGSTLVDTREISLKIYKGKNPKGSMNVQVASGTYLSTICGLGFDVVGRGAFVDCAGNRFHSKKSNAPTILTNFGRAYGPSTEPYLNEVLKLTNETHKLRDIPIKPNKENLDATRKSIGTNAIQPFIKLLSEMNSNGLLKQRLLGRLGFNSSNKKEVAAACFTTGNKVQVFNSIGNHKFHRNIRLLNRADTTLVFTKAGQGVGFSFKSANQEDILTTTMPLTININGAWANKDRYDKLDGCYYKEGQRRVTKSKQLDTSTNLWLDMGQVF